jgi:hypothetical protein
VTISSVVLALTVCENDVMIGAAESTVAVIVAPRVMAMT